MTSSPLNRWRFPPFATHLSARRALMRICGGTLLLLLISPHVAVAQSQSELKVKAAYVFNLTKYVEWPDHKKSLVIAVEGDGPMVATLRDALAGKVSDSRNMEVVISPTDADLDRCDVLYVARSDKKRIDAALRKVAGHSVLTVGDAASFTEARRSRRAANGWRSYRDPDQPAGESKGEIEDQLPAVEPGHRRE